MTKKELKRKKERLHKKIKTYKKILSKFDPNKTPQNIIQYYQNKIIEKEYEKCIVKNRIKLILDKPDNYNDDK